jgi:hypothetical protein
MPRSICLCRQRRVWGPTADRPRNNEPESLKPDPKEPVAIFWSTDRSTWKRPFAELLVKSEFGDNGHSRVSPDSWDKIATERLNPKSRELALPTPSGWLGRSENGHLNYAQAAVRIAQRGASNPQPLIAVKL